MLHGLERPDPSSLGQSILEDAARIFWPEVVETPKDCAKALKITGQIECARGFEPAGDATGVLSFDAAKGSDMGKEIRKQRMGPKPQCLFEVLPQAGDRPTRS
jgi:hypothetical protein